jgi:16S rRNA (guanine966-N2)-methyltransferase
MRITGGSLRSRRLVAPAGTATRPTTDRVREALFSMIATRMQIAGARVLDLYAGTGSLGIEALSRGAAEVVFVECERPAAAALRENLTTLSLGGQATLVVNKIDRTSSGHIGLGAIDLVLVDPPYDDVPSGRLAKALDRLFPELTFSTEALLVVEHASRNPPPLIARWVLSDSRRHGDTTLSFYGV